MISVPEETIWRWIGNGRLAVHHYMGEITITRSRVIEAWRSEKKKYAKQKSKRTSTRRTTAPNPKRPPTKPAATLERIVIHRASPGKQLITKAAASRLTGANWAIVNDWIRSGRLKLYGPPRSKCIDSDELYRLMPNRIRSRQSTTSETSPLPIPQPATPRPIERKENRPSIAERTGDSPVIAREMLRRLLELEQVDVKNPVQLREWARLLSEVTYRRGQLPQAEREALAAIRRRIRQPRTR
jgi:hypothetical protein